MSGLTDARAYPQQLGGFTARARPAFGLRPTVRGYAQHLLGARRRWK
jgi:hypothetical protein